VPPAVDGKAAIVILPPRQRVPALVRAIDGWPSRRCGSQVQSAAPQGQPEVGPVDDG